MLAYETGPAVPELDLGNCQDRKNSAQLTRSTEENREFRLGAAQHRRAQPRKARLICGIDRYESLSRQAENWQAAGFGCYGRRLVGGEAAWLTPTRTD